MLVRTPLAYQVEAGEEVPHEELGLAVRAEEVEARVGAERGVALAPRAVVLEHTVVSAPAVVRGAGQEPRHGVAEPHHVRVLKDTVPAQPHDRVHRRDLE